MSAQNGPGPIVHGRSMNDPDRFIVELPDGDVPVLMTRQEIAGVPVRRQWFRGTQTGLIASFWSRDVAERDAEQLGVILGQIMPIDASKLNGVVVVLTDEHGRPLKGAS